MILSAELFEQIAEALKSDGRPSTSRDKRLEPRVGMTGEVMLLSVGGRRQPRHPCRPRSRHLTQRHRSLSQQTIRQRSALHHRTQHTPRRAHLDDLRSRILPKARRRSLQHRRQNPAGSQCSRSRTHGPPTQRRRFKPKKRHGFESHLNRHSQLIFLSPPRSDPPPAESHRKSLPRSLPPCAYPDLQKESPPKAPDEFHFSPLESSPHQTANRTPGTNYPAPATIQRRSALNRPERFKFLPVQRHLQTMRITTRRNPQRQRSLPR